MQIQNKSNTKMEQSNCLEQNMNKVGLIIDISIVQEYINKSNKIQVDLGTNSFIPAEI